MHIDQSTLEGNRDILDTVMEELLGNEKEEWFTVLTCMILTGDQLTLARIRGILRLQWDEEKVYYHLEWAVPVLQLFHLQMNFASFILKTHYGAVESPGSLSYFLAILGRKGISPDKSNFHALDEFLRQVFDVLVLLMWEVELDSNNLPTKISASQPDLSHNIRSKVECILQQYLCASNNSGCGNQ